MNLHLPGAAESKQEKAKLPLYLEVPVLAQRILLVLRGQLTPLVVRDSFRFERDCDFNSHMYFGMTYGGSGNSVHFSVIVLIALKTGHIIGGHIIPLKEEVRFGTQRPVFCRFRLLVTPGYTYAWRFDANWKVLSLLLNEGPSARVLGRLLGGLVEPQYRLDIRRRTRSSMIRSSQDPQFQ